MNDVVSIVDVHHPHALMEGDGVMIFLLGGADRGQPRLRHGFQEVLHALGRIAFSLLGWRRVYNADEAVALEHTATKNLAIFVVDATGADVIYELL